MQRLLLLSLVLCVLSLVVVHATEEKPFSFYDFFHGEWEVQRSTAFYRTSAQSFDELPGHYSIQKENGTSNLIGRYYENDTTTGNLENEMAIAVDFETPNSGVFKTGSTEYDFQPLFRFEFIQQPNGMAISHGEWLGTKPGFYQFNVGHWDKFTITVTQKDGPKEEVLVYVGKKVPEATEKSFFQKYGTFLMIGGFLIFNMFIQRKTQAMQQGYQQKLAAKAPEAAAAATGKKNK